MANEVPDLGQLVGDESASPIPPPPARRRPIPTWVIVAGMAVALILAVIILLRIGGPLYNLVFPTSLLKPDGVEEVEHNDPEKGTENWLFRTDQSAQDVVRFYEDEGGTCTYKPEMESGRVDAYCTGETSDYGWEVFISSTSADAQTVFRIFKYDSFDF